MIGRLFAVNCIGLLCSLTILVYCAVHKMYVDPNLDPQVLFKSLTRDQLLAVLADSVRAIYGLTAILWMCIYFWIGVCVVNLAALGWCLMRKVNSTSQP
jgi:hypothetical protein